MRYFIADLHDMDPNIITYTHRPFSDVDEQHRHFVKAWNERVEDDDEVFLLGDIGNPSILFGLKGKITIVCGNHDIYEELVRAVREMGIEERVYISKHAIFIEPLLLSHEPVTFIPPEFPYLNIHGHLHGLEYGKGEDWEGGKRYFNVAAENIGYAPISESEIVERIDC